MDDVKIIATKALDSASSAHKRTDELKKYAEKEINGLRDDRHAMHDAIHKNAGQISLILIDQKEMKKVVASNTEAMGALTLSSNEINTTFKSVVRMGKFLTWALGIVAVILVIIKTLTVVQNASS